MSATMASTKEVVVPVQVFTVLRRELEKEVGTLPAVRALHHAGYAAGGGAASSFEASGTAESLPDLAAGDFWRRIERFFSKRGWGTLSHEDVHPGVGVLRSPDWLEATPDATDPEGSCSFTTGYLAGLLSELSSRPVAVLEVTCRSRGDDACRFAFGSEAVIHDLYGQLLEGADFDRALEAL
ncbi:MAG: 4-vinyl reductase [Gemmatimonadota bacterium]